MIVIEVKIWLKLRLLNMAAIIFTFPLKINSVFRMKFNLFNNFNVQFYLLLSLMLTINKPKKFIYVLFMINTNFHWRIFVSFLFLVWIDKNDDCLFFKIYQKVASFAWNNMNLLFKNKFLIENCDLYYKYYK